MSFHIQISTLDDVWEQYEVYQKKWILANILAQLA
jgi:hypothetical protein